MEYYKWEAIKHFQNSWDVDAVDFADMFKQSVSKTSNLINNRVVQPINGIIKLAEKPELCETVREAFRTLFYTDDKGDFDKRQVRIESFVDTINGLLDSYEHGRWKYKQDFRVGLFYLNLFAPQDNYLFKSTNCRLFLNYIEYGDDFGSGSDFSLKRYYKMCDEVLAEIKNTPQLLEKHQARLNENMVCDDDYHIMVFDMIYCSSVYDLYGDLTYKKPIRLNAKEKALSQKQEELTQELKAIHNELNDVYIELGAFDYFSAVGIFVKNKFGSEGKIINQKDNTITVSFPDKEAKYVIPKAFIDGFITVEDEETVSVFNEISELQNRIHRLKLEIQAKEIEMNKLNH